MSRYLGASLLILLSVLVSRFYPGSNSLKFFEGEEDTSSYIPPVREDIKSLRWQTLQKLDYKKNETQDEDLKKAINSHVKIPGFAVPLTDNLQMVQEFLLVPNQMACIHVPAPPPNLIVFVKLPKALPIQELIGPLWLSGILRLKTIKSIYGSSSYEMTEDVDVTAYTF